MHQLVTQILLPLVLASIMLGMGLGLKTTDFSRLWRHPQETLIGLSLQLLLLPALALLIIAVLPLSPIAAAGLFLVSLCPGGATSNLFSFIARGNLALSVTLTAITSMLSPLILPVAFMIYMHVSGQTSEQFSVPMGTAIKQLALVTIVPIAIGMLLRFLAPLWAERVVPFFKKASLIAMIGIILAILATNTSIIQHIFSLNAVAVLLLSTMSLTIVWVLVSKLPLKEDSRRTITIEVGIQNAGTAMMVALAILHQPALASVPLLYGLLMNIPAFSFVAWQNRLRAVYVS